MRPESLPAPATSAEKDWVDGELVRSFGLNFDVTALFPAKWGFR